MQGRGTPASPRQNSGNPQGSNTRQGKTGDTSPVFSGPLCSVNKEDEGALERGYRRENCKAREPLAQPWPRWEAAKAEPCGGGSLRHAAQSGHRSTALAPGAGLSTAGFWRTESIPNPIKPSPICVRKPRGGSRDNAAPRARTWQRCQLPGKKLSSQEARRVSSLRREPNTRLLLLLLPSRHSTGPLSRDNQHLRRPILQAARAGAPGPLARSHLPTLTP